MAWKDYPQNIKVRLITSFFNRAIASSVMPFMALFFAQHKGAVWAGIFLAITVIISFFINFIGGYISDRFPRKKIIILSSASSALMFGLMTISLLPAQKWILLFAISYVIFTITSSLGRPAVHAIIIDSTTPENRKSVYALDYWLVNLAMAIGAALGGLLYVNHQLELFITLTIVSISLPVAYGIWLKDTRVKLLEKKHENIFIDLFHNYKVAFQDKPFVMVVAGSMFIFAAEFSLNSYIGVRLADEFKSVFIGNFEVAGVRMLSFLNIENMLMVVVLTFFVSKLTDKFSPRKMLLLGLLLYGAGYTIVTSSNIWYVLIIFNAIATIGELIYSPIANAEKANMMPEDKRGSYSAFSNLGFNGADLIARGAIVLGAFLVPTMMSIYLGIILMAGTFLLYSGLFVINKIRIQKNMST
ncbi:MFS transporter [Neobacillus sp. 179-C4.2 HS]|uniref:MFS transporter n=1 Tax=Neobacillus driksii TaxID=3035913 RepID=A0ABV4YZ48_9BACI|nr:MFS transporter [Neobacillus sp. 179.-C4.2 HS]MDP5195911.1 MFS transporter [Neobacillus sp. 179.-C4.2 HS]